MNEMDENELMKMMSENVLKKGKEKKEKDNKDTKQELQIQVKEGCYNLLVLNSCTRYNDGD